MEDSKLSVVHQIEYPIYGNFDVNKYRKGGAARNKPVHIRRVNIRIAQSSNGIKSLIVREKKQDVRSLGRLMFTHFRTSLSKDQGIGEWQSVCLYLGLGAWIIVLNIIVCLTF